MAFDRFDMMKRFQDLVYNGSDRMIDHLQLTGRGGFL